MTLLKPLALSAVLAPLALGPAFADGAARDIARAARPHHVYLVGPLRVSRAWLDPATAAADGAAAYLLVENRSSSPDRLVSATVKGAASVTLTPPGDAPAGTALVVPPKGTLTLSRGEGHLAVQGLQGVTAGSPPLEGTLRFEKAGSLHLTFATSEGDVTQDDQSAPATEDRPVDLTK